LSKLTELPFLESIEFLGALLRGNYDLQSRSGRMEE